MSFQVGDVVQYVFNGTVTDQIAVVIDTKNTYFVTVRRMGGRGEQWATSVITHYCKQHEFQCGELVTKMLDEEEGVVVRQIDTGHRAVVELKLKNQQTVYVKVRKLIHKRAIEGLVEEKQCVECGGTGEIVLFQFPRKCGCMK